MCLDKKIMANYTTKGVCAILHVQEIAVQQNQFGKMVFGSSSVNSSERNRAFLKKGLTSVACVWRNDFYLRVSATNCPFD